MSGTKENPEGKILDAFAIYNSQTNPKDTRFIDGCNKSLDTLLVFAGLFSAIVTAFIVQLSTGNPSDRTNELLTELIKQLGHTNYQANIDMHPDTVPSVLVNVFLFCSLTITLLSALTAMLIKQWVFTFGERTKKGLRAQEKARARRRARRALDKWKLGIIISSVPILIHIGLAFFIVALLIYLYEAGQRAVFASILGISALGFLLYIFAVVIGLTREESPFQWPVVSLLGHILRIRSLRHEIGAQKPYANLNRSILVPIDPRTEGTQPLPDATREDTAILCQVIEESLYVSDTCRALSELRRIMLLDTFDPAMSFTLPDDPPNAIGRRLMVLKKCVSVASSCVAYVGSSPYLVEGCEEQARAICNFLDVYLQIKWTGDNHYDQLCLPIVGELIQAYRDELVVTKGSQTELVTALSVRSMHSHKVMNMKGKCEACLDGYTEPVRQLVKGGQILPLPNQTTPWSDINPLQMLRSNRLLRIYVTRLTECQLHFRNPDSTIPYVLFYQKPIREGLERMSQGTTELKLLRKHLEKQRKAMLPDAPASHTEWLEAVTPSASLYEVNTPYEDVGDGSHLSIDMSHASNDGGQQNGN